MPCIAAILLGRFGLLKPASNNFIIFSIPELSYTQIKMSFLYLTYSTMYKGDSIYILFNFIALTKDRSQNYMIWPCQGVKIKL
jgi:hypothetical protein